MEKFYTVGYQYLVTLDEKKEISDKSGLILSNNTQHSLLSGTVQKIGSHALKENPEIKVGHRLYFHATAVRIVVLNQQEFAIIQSRDILAAEEI